MTGISRRRWGAASWLCARADGAVAARVGLATRKRGRALARRASFRWPRPSCSRPPGPPPADTTVTFIAGEPRVIVLRHGPPENVVFAEVSFAPSAFRADSGRPVKVEVRPRPGVYGLDLVTSVPFSTGASVVFKYPRYFSAPAKARADLRERRAVRARARDRPGAGRTGQSWRSFPPPDRARQPPGAAARARHLPRGRAQ